MTSTLQQGDNIRLPNIKEIVIAIKWQKKSNNSELDIDTSAFLLTDNNKVRSDADFIFYNQPTAENNTVILKNNCFKISLANITNDITRLCFTLTLHNTETTRHNLSLLDNILIEVFNFADKQKILSYSISSLNTDNGMGMILATLYRYQDNWAFKAIGQSYNKDLAFLARKFGVVIDEEPNQSTVDNQPEINNAVTENTHNQSKTDENKTTQPHQQQNNKPNIHNTDMMTKQVHYAPIVQWFELKNCRTVVNENATDTSGFFDEVAVMLGDSYGLLKIVSDTIKYRQSKNRDKAYIDLTNHNQKEAEDIKNFCKALYDYTFIARYFHDKKTKKLILTLQSANKIVNFFNGEWLEWYAMMKIATFCHHKNITFSCIRNMLIYPEFESTKYEIDLFFLINDRPLFIECKSGEYRGFIDKYSRLRKKLFMRKEHFIMLISGTQEETLNGLNAMFDISFINETKLISHITKTFSL